jgi:hypothetical protein
MTRLEEKLEEVAGQFAQRVVEALWRESIGEVMWLASRGTRGERAEERPAGEQPTAKAPAKETKGKNPGTSKRQRRSGSELETLVERVVQAVETAAKESSEGLAVGELAKVLRRPSSELTRPLHLALQARRLKKKGERRHTRYFPVK